jgi:hypothetical protein
MKPSGTTRSSFPAAHGSSPLTRCPELPEQWNRLGTKPIPKLRATNGLRVEILLSGSASAGSARALAIELTQIVEELGLQAKLRVSCE